jgi:hypothetical protein
MREKGNPGKDILKMRSQKSYSGIFCTAMYIILLAVFIHGCAKDEANVMSEIDPLKAVGIVEILPANLADSVVVNPIVTATFKSGTTPSNISASSITLKKGNTPVPGKITFTDKAVLFTADADLTPDDEYTATIKTVIKGITNSDEIKEYSWRFKTGKHHRFEDISILAVAPLNSATGVATTFQPGVTFEKELTLSMKNSITFSLDQGTKHVEGSVSFSGNTATFKPLVNLTAKTVYTGNVTFGNNEAGDHKSDHDFSWSFTTSDGGNDITAPVINSVVPSNNATAVPVNSLLTIVFSEAMNPSTINSTTISLKQGTTAVPGNLTYSGSSATFSPSSSLLANSLYSGIITTGAKDAAGNSIAVNYSWSFTTASATDLVAPTVVSVVPLNSATSVVTNSKPTVTFSEAMNPLTITSATFTLKQGTTNVAGAVSYTGTTATFTPTGILTGSTVYTGTVTTSAKDVAGNALASNYTWSFTTASATDLVAPTVVSVVPLNSAASVATNSKPTVTFSEAMNPSTITSATFTLKQGTTTIAGTVSYTGNTATFAPTSVLTAGTGYTATITTVAKDIAGNALASNYTWSFTTVASTPAGLSFASDVVPALNTCNVCHTHSWTTSSSASTFYTNLVSSGYVNAASYTTSKLYTKMNAGHPSSTKSADMTKIITWMSEGSKNN